MVFAGDAVDAFHRHALHRNHPSLQFGKQFFGEFALYVSFTNILSISFRLEWPR